MDKLAILGTDEFQAPLIKKAHDLGFETHVFARKSGNIGERIADFYYPVSVEEKQLILDTCLDLGISGICSISSAIATPTVNHVSRKLDIRCNSPYTDMNAQDRYKMFISLAAQDITVPRFCIVTPNFDITSVDDYLFPVRVCTNIYPNHNIRTVECIDDLPDTVNEVCNESTNGYAFIEEYTPGDEYSAECISYGGHHTLLTYTKVNTTGSPYYITTGYTQPTNLFESKRVEIQSIVFRALNALQISHGASHVNIKLTNKGKVRVIDVVPCMNGDYIGSDLVAISTGLDYLHMVIDIACGHRPCMQPSASPCRAEIRFIITQKDMVLYQDTIANYPSFVYRKSEFAGSVIQPITNNSPRIGYYILCSAV